MTTPDPVNQPTETSQTPAPSPSFVSLALASIPVPDYADVIVLPVPAGSPVEPRLWAETIFSGAVVPLWVKWLMGIRQTLVALIGVKPSPTGIFAVSGVVGEEALISADDKHLDFRCGVALDASRMLLRVTTAVRLKGWRGRLYFLPVRLLHPLVVHAMMARAIRVLTPR
ncbi:DUF2867 domain-containing protein [Arthrobacter rhizosphaerae]|uniref:DUF2867 domain-containing protein n=1 Tax=Arthrobacter rhizosphaerae TaxID=2855490 RepID=UPI001FF1994F|nr:DUF2867 domain-containing protein [Arthrobacter rhizosphaerae]